MIPLAHAGHWALWILYALPLVIVVWSVVLATINERRSRREEDDQGSDG